ncbi:MAG: MarR family transcriptional regulator [Longimicrobiales bacterium]|nr:MarR family transcriptional regulator [Longimicrobiales bacterium]
MAQAFNEALSELVRVIQFRDRDRACCHDLSVTQCYALKGVVDEGKMTVNELAAHLYLDKSTASRVANGLVEKEMLEKRRDEQDGRLVHLLPTERGRRVQRAIESDLLAEYAELLEEFDPAFRAAIVKLMRRLRKTFRARVDASGGSCCFVGDRGGSRA